MLSPSCRIVLQGRLGLWAINPADSPHLVAALGSHSSPCLAYSVCGKELERVAAVEVRQHGLLDMSGTSPAHRAVITAILGTLHGLVLPWWIFDAASHERSASHIKQPRSSAAGPEAGMQLPRRIGDYGWVLDAVSHMKVGAMWDSHGAWHSDACCRGH